MKRYLSLVLLLALLLAGCADSPDRGTGPAETPQPGPLTIYASVYPVYAIARFVTRDVENVVVHCLTQPLASCPRSYTLSDWDAALLAGADLTILGGRGLEGFTLPQELPQCVLMTKSELLQGEEKSADAEEASHFEGANPWLFLSLDGLSEMAETLAVELGEADPAYAEQYLENAAAAQEAVEEARARIEEIMLPVDAGPVAVLHEGLLYVAEDLDLYAAAVIRREPGEDLEASEFAAAVNGMTAAGVRICLVEQQAPDRLVRDLTGAGFTVVRLDTLMLHTETEPETVLNALVGNAEKIAAAAS